MAADIWQLFSNTYLDKSIDKTISYSTHHLYEDGDFQGIDLNIEINGQPHSLKGKGNGPIDAATHAMEKIGFAITVRNYEERSVNAVVMGSDANACAFIQISDANDEAINEVYGVGIDPNIVTASIKALISGINRIN